MRIKSQIPRFQPLNFSTITIIGELNVSDLNIKYFSDNFESPVFPCCFLKKTKKHGDYIETKRGKIKKSFYNQITMQYTDHTTKSIKIFSNGKLQITGITSMYEADFVANMICDILNTVFENSEYHSEKFTAKNIAIGMINTNFSFGHKIDILELRKLLLQEDECSVDYEPDVYPGLKIKYQANTSIFLFATGNVLITGVKSIKEIENAFNFITNNVISNWEYLNIGEEKIKKSIKTIDTIHGYKINEYRCASPSVS